MGTNYYVEKRDKSSQPLHIGKSSAGWCFMLHVIPEMGIHDIEGWVPFLLNRESFICDEYGNEISYIEMLKVIFERSWSGPMNWTEQDFRVNRAEPGPNNLVRCRLGGNVVRHGIGTWDCLTGEFT